jgi:parallel beta-helix repeat protein
LYALGTADSVITFTSWNGLPGGWNGIYFTDASDSYSAQSQLDYCVIENGNDYNYLSVNTSHPTLINHSKIRNAVLDGARYDNSFGSVTNNQFTGNGRYPLHYMNPEADPVRTGNTYTGNTINYIALSGGTYSFDRTIIYEGGIQYYVLGDLFVAKYAGHSRLTVNPGVILAFAVGKKLQVGVANSYGGDLYALGTAGSPIIFKAYNATPGGWGGIYFTDQNDTWGGTSVLTYCTVKQGATYNIYMESSTQPSLDHCIISLSAADGIVSYQSNGPITNCTFLNNAGYPLKFNDWTCDSYLRGNTYTGNTPNYIALSGGDYSGSRRLYYDGIPYRVLSDIRIVGYAGHPRITITPGVTMAFEPGTGIQVGLASSYGGDLFAEGKSDSLITFKPYNNAVGGWDGIYFNEYNDHWGGISSIKYCTIDKGSAYNLSVEGSTQPSLDHCTISNSGGIGILSYQSNFPITNCAFLNNAGYPLKYNDWTCNSYLFGNTYTGNTPNYIAL